MLESAHIDAKHQKDINIMSKNSNRFSGKCNVSLAKDTARVKEIEEEGLDILQGLPLDVPELMTRQEETRIKDATSDFLEFLECQAMGCLLDENEKEYQAIDDLILFVHFVEIDGYSISAALENQIFAPMYYFLGEGFGGEDYQKECFLKAIGICLRYACFKYNEGNFDESSVLIHEVKDLRIRDFPYPFNLGSSYCSTELHELILHVAKCYGSDGFLEFLKENGLVSEKSFKEVG